MIEHLSTETTSVVVDVRRGIPVVLHWGARIDEIPETWSRPPVPYGAIQFVEPISIVPMHGDGFMGRPGFQAHRRGGRHWSPRFVYESHSLLASDEESTLVCQAVDEIAELRIETRITLTYDSVLKVQSTVENFGDSPLMLDAFTVSLPLPSHAEELGVFAGRWIREFDLQRFAWPYGAWTSENRLGRTSHEHPPYIWSMQTGAGEWAGDVWGVHAAWSGNHVVYAEKLPDGRRYIQSGELFHAGEMCVYAGETFSTTEVIGVYSSRGLTPASWGFHNEARRRAPRQNLSPRPVHLNTWEAVYFNHDVNKLKELADRAADVGIERFVLDDGWFGGRRNDRTGLGDWWVSGDVYPDGLTPLIDHVTDLGMQFGIWIEPEMVNPDSDLLRAHPDWALATDGYDSVLGRNQLVLDLSRQEAFDHVLTQLDALLTNHDISYIKWDMNRWHVQGSSADGKAGTHDQTVAMYALLDALRDRHPDVEFESCASGGGRIDHEMLRRVERVWTSDSNDALERQFIQRGASMVIPPEVMGSHIGPSRSHTTGRRHTMAFRGVTALFGHLGIEADITQCDDDEIAQLAQLIDIYQGYRDLLHGGDTVRFDTFAISAGTSLAHGVYSRDRTEGLLAYCQLSSDTSLTPPTWRIPDLIPDRQYRVDIVPTDPSGSVMVVGPASQQPDWVGRAQKGEPLTYSGEFLASVGLPAPIMWPESAVLVHLSCS